MKKHMKTIANKATSFFKRSKVGRDQRGQGMTEYALLLLVIVALVTIFKDKISSAVSGKLGEVGDKIGSFSGEQ